MRIVPIAAVGLIAACGGDDGALHLEIGAMARTEFTVRIAVQPDGDAAVPDGQDVVAPTFDVPIDGPSRVKLSTSLGHPPLEEWTTVAGVEPGDTVRLGFPHPAMVSAPVGEPATLFVRFPPGPGATRHVLVAPCAQSSRVDLQEDGMEVAVVSFVIGGACPATTPLVILAFTSDDNATALIEPAIALPAFGSSTIDVTASWSALPTFAVDVIGLPPEVTRVRARRTAVLGPGGAVELSSPIVAVRGGAATLEVPWLPDLAIGTRLVVDAARADAVGIQRHEHFPPGADARATFDWSEDPLLPWFATVPTVVSPFTWTQIGDGVPDAVMLRGSGDVFTPEPIARETTTFAPGTGAGAASVVAPNAIVHRTTLIERSSIAGYAAFRVEPEAAAFEPLLPGEVRVLSLAPASLEE